MAVDNTVQNQTNFDDVLKIDYMGPIRDQLNNSTVLLSNLETREEMFSGKQAYIPLHTGRNFSHGSRQETDDLPGTAGLGTLRQQFDSATFTASYQYGRIKVSGVTIKASRNDKGAFLKAVDVEMKGMLKDLRNSINRQLFQNGRGILADCGVTSNKKTVLCSDTKFVKPGMYVDIIDEGDDAPLNTNGTQVVQSVPNTTQVVFTNAVTTATDDFITLQGTVNQDIWGLDAIVSTANPTHANFGGIDRSTETFWQATQTGATGDTFSLVKLQEAIDTADIEGEGEVGLIVTNHKNKRNYGDLLVDQKRYPPGGEITLDGGYKALEFNGIPFVADKDAAELANAVPGDMDHIFLLDLSTLFFIAMNDWEWMSKDGAVLSRVQNKDIYEATLFRYFNLVCDQPNANNRLQGEGEAAWI